MITPMMKYSLVLYHTEYNSFLERLQELGLMDVTTRSWEPDETQKELMSSIDQYRKVGETLDALSKTTGFEDLCADKTYASTKEAFDAYLDAYRHKEGLLSESSRLEKECEELAPWGDFEPALIRNLADGGIQIHFYRLSIREFESMEEEWSKQYAMSEVSRDSLHVYLAVALHREETLTIDAQEVKLPTGSLSSKQQEREQIEQQIVRLNATLGSCLPYRSDFKSVQLSLEDQLHLEQVKASGQHEVEDKLILLEGWAPTENQTEVDRLLEETGTFYIKERPTPEDDTPVKLKNNWFSSLSETIGNFYALPKYGTMDLTPFFGPFYILFFGFCLGDGGYGFLYILAALYMILKLGDKLDGQMKRYGWLVFFCGATTMLFGTLTGSFFGMSLGEFAPFAPYRKMFLNSENLFNLSIILGFVHILIAMTLRIIGTAQQNGIRYALGPIGWYMILIASAIALLMPTLGIDGFTTSSPIYLSIVILGLFMMMFLNTPGKNPLVNFGMGLWNTYNDVAGFVGDILSYLRLFALGLAGGVLGFVFNDLAMGLSPDIPVLKQLVIVLILLIGHAINIFMSSLSSFVHPMRLTFVEFYKNAGFEATQRTFNPLKKHNL